MLKKFSYITIFVLSLINIVSAQSTGDAVILLQGKVLDKHGKPVGTTIYFDNNNGKKISTKANSNDGLYQQILTPGKKYVVYFKDYVETSGYIEIEMPATKTYTELNRSFTVAKIEEGMELMRTNIFNPNESTLRGDYNSYFSSLRNFMNTNLNIGVVLTVHVHDCNFKSKTTKEQYKDSKNRTKYRKTTITPAQQAEQLAQARIAELRSYFQTIKIPEKRISFDTDLTFSKPKLASKTKTKKKKENVSEASVNYLPNVIATVGQIKKM